MLPRKKRIDRKYFPIVQRSRLFFRAEGVALRFRCSKVPGRFSVVVNHPYKNAVERNTLRRRVYSMLEGKRCGFDGIVYISGKSGVLKRDFKSKLEELFSNATKTCPLPDA